MDRAAQLGQGSIPHLLLRFSIPAVVGMMAQALYQAIDRFFVGKALGTDGIAGMAIAFPFMLVILAFAMLVGFGAAALISLRLGERRRHEAERALGNAFVLLLPVSMLVTAAGLMFLDQILFLFGADEAVLPYARDYLRIIVLGTIFQIFGFGLNASIRGEGNPRIAMLTILMGVALNTVLAPIFIFGFSWGMKGAALATIMGQALSALWVLGYFLSGASLLKLRLKNLRLDWQICAKIFSIGSPHFFMQLSASVVQCILNNQLRIHGGTLAISVMAIIYAVAMLVAMPIFGINQGAQPIIGYNYGAGRFDRVKTALETAILAASTLTILGFMVAMLLPVQVIQLFSTPKDDDYQALLALGPHAMRLSMLMLPVVGFQIVGASYFQAVGKARQAMILMLSRQVLILIPAVVILPHFFGLDGVWAAMPTADFAAFALTGTRLFFELRHLHRSHAASVGERDERWMKDER
jgi:putative MATE family efflux protein